MSNLTIGTPSTGPELIQAADFYQSANILHPLVIGTIAIALLFAYLRLASNRSIAPITLFDSIVSVALGSTLAGIVNGTALVRGLEALAVLMFWQYGTSWVGAYSPRYFGQLLTSPPLIVAFHGEMLSEVMKAHRISERDLYTALRGKSIWNICEVEVVVIEPNGQFNVFKRADYPEDYEPEVLWDIKGYQALRDHEAEMQREDGQDPDNVSNKSGSGKVNKKDSRGKDANDCAMDNA